MMLELSSHNNLPLKYSFKDKLNYEAKLGLTNKRNETKILFKPIFKPILSKIKENAWEKEPIDLNPKKYRPNPPKRNARESQKPWLYDKFLRPIETKTMPDNSVKINRRMANVASLSDGNYYNSKPNDKKDDFRVYLEIFFCKHL
jgi:hypothetical protein